MSSLDPSDTPGWLALAVTSVVGWFLRREIHKIKWIEENMQTKDDALRGRAELREDIHRQFTNLDQKITRLMMNRGP